MAFVLLFKLLMGSAAVATGLTVQRCPPKFELVRRGQTISTAERKYTSQRREHVLPDAFSAYLSNVKGTGVALPSYVDSILESRDKLPNVGLSISGGGHRAALFGAGVINALDARNASSVRKGTGGLLQAISHIAGLSGGSWTVTSLAQANFPTIQKLIFGDGENYGGWITELDLRAPAQDPVKQTEYVQQLLGEITVKAKHFPVSAGDIWGRTLARHFTNGTTLANFFTNGTHGSGILLSDLIKLPTFASHLQPLPHITINLASKHITGPSFPAGSLKLLPLNTPMFEANLFEFGSYDDALAAHTPLKYLGTTNNSICVQGFDEAMFITATTSNPFLLFNITANILAANTANYTTFINQTFPQSPNIRLDTNNYPNPFFGVAPETFADSEETILAMCDGGLDGQITPYQPMLVKEREIDVIIGVDAANDVPENYAVGASLIATQQRMQIFAEGLATFPSVPASLDVFASQSLLSRPAFFGCTPSTPSSQKPTGPIVVYLANGAPPRDGSAPLTNTSSFQFIYPEEQIQGMLAQTFTIATQGARIGDSLEDPEWAACLACAVVDRERERGGIKRSGVCDSCFTRYCWLEEGRELA
ncbi:Lysophospholipase [Mycena indigotica]|uniref:Lysophospholipase n=1 Tax=Mycena indigotica TaxID=2126181 RepID=A0A8H6SN44_9AGAR|nr:Lysophospholipase [Mycena indigotica]KAF7301905.1 Lysophospholipase [Mycena indigotica]